MSEEEAKELIDTISKEEFPYALAIAKAYEELEKENEELKLQNFNLREDIMIQKMSLPSGEIKDKTFYDLIEMPSYEELNQKYLNAVLDYEQEKFNVEELKKHYDRLYTENCKLRKEHDINDISLLDENYELKEQLEEANKAAEMVIKSLFNGELTQLKNQQQEFIDWLEEEIICYQNYQNTNLQEYARNLVFNVYNDTLEKYKEIIGGVEDE